MSYPTPPPTAHKLGLFSAPRHLRSGTISPRKVYYEDVHGTYNEDEELEGGQERCESESDSDEGRFTAAGRRMKGFGRKSGMVSDPESDSGENMEEAEGEDDGREDVHYQIAPSVNGRRSVAVPKAKEVDDDATTDDQDIVGSTYEKPEQSDKQEGGDDDEDDKAVDIVQAPQVGRGRKRRQRGMGVARPEQRRLLKQQLADSDKQKKLTQRAARRVQAEQRAVQRMAKGAATGGITKKAGLQAKKSSLTKGRVKASKNGKPLHAYETSPSRPLMVIVHNSDIDVRDFAYISD